MIRVAVLSQIQAAKIHTAEMKWLEKFERGKYILSRQYYFSVEIPRVHAKTNLITKPISNFGLSIHAK